MSRRSGQVVDRVDVPKPGRRVGRPAIALALLTGAAIAPAAAQESDPGTLPQPYLGAWEMEDESVVIHFTEEKAAVLYRAALFGHDFVTVYRVRYSDDGARLIRVGEELTARAGPGDTLTLMVSGVPVPLPRSPDLPEALVLMPYPIAVAAPVSAARIAAIKTELAERERRDQDVREGGMPGDSAGLRAMLDTDADNSAYLRGLIQEVGWIATDRYGRAAAGAAFAIVQHSRDLRLMLTALPQIERELPAGYGNPQEFALLFDRVVTNLAEPQRYGTQATQGEDGGWTVHCLESPVMTDDYRGRLGLPPLADYLAVLAEAYGADSIAVEESCPW